MVSNENILISLESRHAKNIFDGNKKVELRRRTMHIAPGTSVWIYEKLPVGSVTGKATVAAIHMDTPTKLWNDFGAVSGLTKAEFFNYFHDIKEGCALVLEHATTLKQPISLSYLRKAVVGFQPPQFFVRLADTNAVLLALRATPRARKRTLQSCNESSAHAACYSERSKPGGFEKIQSPHQPVIYKPYS